MSGVMNSQDTNEVVNLGVKTGLFERLRKNQPVNVPPMENITEETTGVFKVPFAKPKTKAVKWNFTNDTGSWFLENFCNQLQRSLNRVNQIPTIRNNEQAWSKFYSKVNNYISDYIDDEIDKSICLSSTLLNGTKVDQSMVSYCSGHLQHNHHANRNLENCLAQNYQPTVLLENMNHQHTNGTNMDMSMSSTSSGQRNHHASRNLQNSLACQPSVLQENTNQQSTNGSNIAQDEFPVMFDSFMKTVWKSSYGKSKQEPSAASNTLPDKNKLSPVLGSHDDSLSLSIFTDEDFENSPNLSRRAQPKKMKSLLDTSSVDIRTKRKANKRPSINLNVARGANILDKNKAKDLKNWSIKKIPGTVRELELVGYQMFPNGKSGSYCTAGKVLSRTTKHVIKTKMGYFNLIGPMKNTSEVPAAVRSQFHNGFPVQWRQVLKDFWT